MVNGRRQCLRLLHPFCFLGEAKETFDGGVHEFEPFKPSPPPFIIAGRHQGGVVQQSLHQRFFAEFLSQGHEAERQGGVDVVHGTACGQHLQDLTRTLG